MSSYLGHQLSDDNRVDHPTHGVACSDHAHGKAPLLVEILEYHPSVQSLHAQNKKLLLTVDTNASAGVKKMPPPSPVRNPCVIMSCQYLVQMLIKKIPNTCSTAPTKNVGTKKPASRRRPVNTPPIIVNQICNEPIQEMTDGSVSGIVCS